MFDDIAGLQISTFGRPGFVVRRASGAQGVVLIGIWHPQHVELSVDGAGVQFEAVAEAASVLTAAASSLGLAKGDSLAPPHAPGVFRRVVARRDNGYGMSLLVLRNA